MLSQGIGTLLRISLDSFIIGATRVPLEFKAKSPLEILTIYEEILYDIVVTLNRWSKLNF